MCACSEKPRKFEYRYIRFFWYNIALILYLFFLVCISACNLLIVQCCSTRIWILNLNTFEVCKMSCIFAQFISRIVSEFNYTRHKSQHKLSLHHYVANKLYKAGQWREFSRSERGEILRHLDRSKIYSYDTSIWAAPLEAFNQYHWHIRSLFPSDHMIIIFIW